MNFSFGTPAWIFLLTLSIACDDGGGDTDDSGVDASVEVDAAGEDGGVEGPGVTPGLIAAITGTAEYTLPRMELFRSDTGAELAFGYGAMAVQQPVGPVQLALEEERVVLGWNEGRGTPFQWVTYDPSEPTGDRGIGGDSDSHWLHYLATDPGWLGEERVTGPAVVRWSRDGTSERWSVPEGLFLRYLGVGSDGERWMLGRGDGATVVDGSAVGEAGETVLFLAEMDDGLKRPRVLASGSALGGYFLPTAQLLPSGEVLLALLIEDGEVFGEAVSEHHRLFRVAPTTGALTGEWEHVERTKLLGREDGRIELLRPITETTTYGAGTYEPFDRFTNHDDPETWVRVVWDGSGDTIPEGERLALQPEQLVEAGGWRVSRGFELVAQLAEDGSIARWFSSNNGTVMGALPFEGRVWVQVAGSGRAPVTLQIEDGDGVELETLESADPEESFWLVEVDPDTGAVLRQKAFDVGPAGFIGDDRRDAWARPLADDHILVATRPAGEATAEIRIDGWSVDAPTTVITPTVTGAECTTKVQPPELSLAATLERDPEVVQLWVLCDGPHRVELGGAAVDHDGPRSSNLYRLAVD